MADEQRGGAARRIGRTARVARATAGQIIAAAESRRPQRLVERLWGELSEAASEAKSLLGGGGWRISEDELERRYAYLIDHQNLGEAGVDPFGFSPEYVRKVIPMIEFLHRIWFRVESHDIDNVPEQGRCLLVGNHSGQLPFDGMMIGASLLLERDPPRMIRSMVEKFAIRTPWFGTFCMRCGQVTGLPDNCRRLLERDESVMVFPEGARGISKPFKNRYKLGRFGHGFMRLALETGSPIVPIGVVGAEEQIINVGNFEGLARLLNAPNIPIAPLALVLGPLAMWPAPVKYRIYFGEPLYFEGDANDDDAVIAKKVAVVTSAIEKLVARGLEERRGVFI
ncbi:MAG: acyltransferase family protein [Myxococcales bacterium]|nr:acyltransferase family protein [Myxococcales bacterium]